MSEHVSEKEFIFIVAAPRSGTTWLQLMISAHPQVASTVEIRLFNWYVGPLVERWNRELAIIDNLKQGLSTLWSQDDFDKQIAYYVNNVYEAVLKTNPSATHILDKSTGYASYMDMIDRYVPNARYLHLIRDGRDVVASDIKTNEMTKVYGYGDASSASANWVHNVSEASKWQGKNNYYALRYEQLIENPYTSMKEVYSFCHLPISADDLENIVENHQFDKVKNRGLLTDRNTKAPGGHFRKGKIGSWVTDLTTTEKYYLAHNEKFNDLLISLGYVQNNQWWTQTTSTRFFTPFKFYFQCAGIHTVNSLKYTLRPIKRWMDKESN